MAESKIKSSMSESERIVELEAILQSVINERNEAWCQLEENNIEIRPVEKANFYNIKIGY